MRTAVMILVLVGCGPAGPRSPSPGARASRGEAPTPQASAPAEAEQPVDADREAVTDDPGDRAGGSTEGILGSASWPGASEPVPEVTMSVTAVTGGLTRATLQLPLQQEMSRFSYCYERQVLAEPALEGTVLLAMTIDASGVVSEASAQGGTEAVSTCMAAVARAAQFGTGNAATPTRSTVLHPVASECMAAAVSPGHFPARKAGTPCEVVARIECSYAERRAR